MKNIKLHKTYNGVRASGSYRMQWVLSRVQPKDQILNIGVGDNLIGFGENTLQFDMDKYLYDNFVQGDAHQLPFKDNSFDTVVISDVMEHVINPTQVCKEATRVCRRLILSIFEEWRLGGEGQHIEIGHEVQREGMRRRNMVKYDDAPNLLERIPEETISHNPHIWQFTDKIIRDLIWSTGWKVVEFCKEPECVHLGHTWWNWLIVLKKPEPYEKIHYPGHPVNHLPVEVIQEIFSGREYQEDV